MISKFTEHLEDCDGLPPPKSFTQLPFERSSTPPLTLSLAAPPKTPQLSSNMSNVSTPFSPVFDNPDSPESSTFDTDASSSPTSDTSEQFPNASRFSTDSYDCKESWKAPGFSGIRKSPLKRLEDTSASIPPRHAAKNKAPGPEISQTDEPLPCLQCEFAGLPCNHAYPTCSRCQRHAEEKGISTADKPCLAQRKAMFRDASQCEVLVEFETDDPQYAQRRRAFYNEMLESEATRKGLSNWAPPTPKNRSEVLSLEGREVVDTGVRVVIARKKATEIFILPVQKKRSLKTFALWKR